MEDRELLNYIRFFREKANKNKLIIFVGAGVSCNVDNMPSWNTLIKKMADAIKYSRCSTCKKKDRKCQTTCKFIDSFSTDEYLKIPQYVYNRNKKLYNQVLSDNIRHNPAIDAPLSNAILDLGPAHVITTNYDKLIENCKSAQRVHYEVIINDRDLLRTEKNKYIIKMHGDIDNLDTIVLKEADYLDYTQKHVLIEMFVKSLLTDHTILFLGYSLNDYNIKLIISWINYIRMQNKALDKSTKFAYIVLDDKRISKTQSKYFESNNIGVVNLHNMPLINDIPHDLTNEIGKRLYSFLRIIDDASLERYLGKLVSYDEAVNAIGKYKYVNSQNICNLLYLGTYSTTGNELTIFSEANYDSLVNYFNTKSENALALKQHFINAGIRNIRLISTSTTRRNEKYDIEDTFHNTILDNKLFVAYINNNYIGLIIQLNSETIEGVFESAFYTTLVKDYISQVFEWYDDMKEVELTIEQKIRYLFNKATLESQKTYNRFDASSLERYIDGIPDVNQKKLYQSYKDILSGNYQKLFDIEKALEKLKEQYNNENYSFIGCSSLQELYKIKKVAIDQYLFYFNNTLFFKGFSDLKKILKVYIEAIICTNGQFQEITSTKWGGVSKKDRYEIDAIDFDIITKFISIKDLYNLLKEYKVESFKTLDENVDYFVSCLDNITKTVTQLKLYDRLGDIPQTLINCLLLLTHLSINDKQKNVLGEIVINLMTDSEFVEFFFSINCPDHFVSLKIMNSFLKALPKQHNLDIVKKIILNPNFKSYYINIDTYGLRNLLSHFIDIETVPSAQDELVDFISSFEGKDKMNVIRLLYKHIKKPELQRQYTVYMNTHFDLLDNDDVLDFAFNDLLEITPELEQKIFDGAIKLYQTQQNSAIHSFPDPMESKMELIYILFIVGKIQDLSPLKDIAKDNDFLQFFLDDGFDYSKIDFSNYMWQNIARQERFHDKFIAHKQEIIPNIKHKIDLGTITDFESKMLYGILLEPEELFNK